MSKKRSPKSAPQTKAAEIESLYDEFLDCFYGDNDRDAAAKLVVPLEETLANSPEYADSIRAEEVRSLLAEFRGDFVDAVRSREAEIRKILELHALSVNTADWEYVAKHYDYTDVGDRLDLLALLYDKLGDFHRAMATLKESKNYCHAHGVPFDGQDILDELTKAQAKKAGRKSKKSVA